MVRYGMKVVAWYLLFSFLGLCVGPDLLRAQAADVGFQSLELIGEVAAGGTALELLVREVEAEALDVDAGPVDGALAKVVAAAEDATDTKPFPEAASAVVVEVNGYFAALGAWVDAAVAGLGADVLRRLVDAARRQGGYRNVKPLPSKAQELGGMAKADLLTKHFDTIKALSKFEKNDQLKDLGQRVKGRVQGRELGAACMVLTALAPLAIALLGGWNDDRVEQRDIQRSYEARQREIDLQARTARLQAEQAEAARQGALTEREQLQNEVARLRLELERSRAGR